MIGKTFIYRKPYFLHYYSDRNTPDLFLIQNWCKIYIFPNWKVKFMQVYGHVLRLTMLVGLMHDIITQSISGRR